MTGWEWLGIGGLSQGYVAAGLIPAAVASDTGGSIRIPATLCGVSWPDFGELFLGRSARTPQPAAPGRHLPQATTGPAVTAAGAHQASHEG